MRRECKFWHIITIAFVNYFWKLWTCCIFSTIPDGFNIGDVLPEMTGLINSKWKFSNNGAAEVMKEVLQWGHPSVCVSTQDGTPVAWALQNFCGIVSNLFTEEEYRMKGIGNFRSVSLDTVDLGKRWKCVCIHWKEERNIDKDAWKAWLQAIQRKNELLMGCVFS